MSNVKKYTGIVLLILLVFFKIQDSNFVMKIENISYDAYQSLFIKKDESIKAEKKLATQREQHERLKIQLQFIPKNCTTLCQQKSI